MVAKDFKEYDRLIKKHKDKIKRMINMLYNISIVLGVGVLFYFLIGIFKK